MTITSLDVGFCAALLALLDLAFIGWIREKRLPGNPAFRIRDSQASF